MAVGRERGWWIALVLAGALVLHLFMLTGVPQRPGVAAPHADGMAGPAAPPASGDHASGAHRAAEMLSTCFAVLALVTAGVAYLRGTRGKPAADALKGHAGQPGPQVDDATCRDGPRPSRVDAGVLLRV